MKINQLKNKEKRKGHPKTLYEKIAAIKTTKIEICLNFILKQVYNRGIR